MTSQADDPIMIVRSRVAAKFPDVDSQLVDDTVNSALERFSSAKITDFVPLLVERSATAKLAGGGA